MSRKRRTSHFLTGRKQRKEDLIKLIQENPNNLGWTRLRAVFSMKTGNTHNKIDEYLDELVDAGLVNVDRSDPSNIKVTAAI